MAAGKNLVLGGADLIGRALCSKLKSKGQEIINLDLKTGFDLRKDNARLKNLVADLSLDDAILKEGKSSISAGVKNPLVAKLAIHNPIIQLQPIQPRGKHVRVANIHQSWKHIAIWIRAS